MISAFTQSESAESIVRKSEERLRASTAIAEMSIYIKRSKWDKKMELKAWIKGTDRAAAFILSPLADSGTVFLKNGDDVWNYLPKIKKTIRMPAATLSQNWMGSDLTNDDLINGSTYSEDYNASLKGEVNYGGLNCHKIELLPKEESQSIWGKIILYIDKQDFIQMHASYFDEDLELVHQIDGYKVKNLGGKKLASKYIMTQADKKGQSTTLIYKSIQFNLDLKDSFFEKENISKIKP
jgi:outer membrane lipoprotein-sorting protein